MKRLKFIWFLLLAVAIQLTSKGEIMISAKLDSVNLLMGNMTTLHIEVVKDKDLQGNLSIFNNINPAKGFVGVCGDSVELRTSYKADTTDIGSGRMQINYSIPVQAFDSGTYRLPRFVYVAGKDSAFSNHLTFNVVPVNASAEDPIAGYAMVSEPEGKRFYDFVPDWILDFWWIFIVIVLAIIAFMWGMNRYRKTGTILAVKKMPTPYEKAMDALFALKDKKQWEKGMEKEYFTDLTDILRNYLDERFGINAMEMTTSQIMQTLSQSDVKDKKDYIRDILNVADFVKFAKVRPLPDDSIKSLDNAIKFVEETKPEEIKPEEDEDSEEDEEKGGDK